MYVLKAALRHLFNPFQRFKLSAPSFNTAQLSDYKAAVLICSEDFTGEAHLAALETEVAKHFKDFLVLMFVPGRKKEVTNHPHFLCLDSSTFTFTGRIESSVMTQWTDQKIDLLISLSGCNRLLYQQCLKDLPASFKTGILKQGQSVFFHLTCHSDLTDEAPEKKLIEVIDLIKKLKIHTT